MSLHRISRLGNIDYISRLIIREIKNHITDCKLDNVEIDENSIKLVFEMRKMSSADFNPGCISILLNQEKNKVYAEIIPDEESNIMFRRLFHIQANFVDTAYGVLVEIGFE